MNPDRAVVEALRILAEEVEALMSAHDITAWDGSAQVLSIIRTTADNFEATIAKESEVHVS